MFQYPTKKVSHTEIGTWSPEYKSHFSARTKDFLSTSFPLPPHTHTHTHTLERTSCGFSAVTRWAAIPHDKEERRASRLNDKLQSKWTSNQSCEWQGQCCASARWIHSLTLPLCRGPTQQNQRYPVPPAPRRPRHCLAEPLIHSSNTDSINYKRLYKIVDFFGAA